MTERQGKPAVHRLIIGTSTMGKTWWTAQAAQACIDAGMNVIVYDGTECNQDGTHNSGYGLGDWPTDVWVTSDFDEFESVFWSNLGVVAIVEEASEICEDHKVKLRLRRMLKRGRHVRNGAGGNQVWLIAQRMTDLDKTARDQCTHITLFMVDIDDAKAIARKFSAPELEEAHKQEELEYMISDAAGRVTYGTLGT